MRTFDLLLLSYPSTFARPLLFSLSLLLSLKDEYLGKAFLNVHKKIYKNGKFPKFMKNSSNLNNYFTLGRRPGLARDPAAGIEASLPRAAMLSLQ